MDFRNQGRAKRVLEVSHVNPTHAYPFPKTHDKRLVRLSDPEPLASSYGFGFALDIDGRAEERHVQPFSLFILTLGFQFESSQSRDPW